MEAQANNYQVKESQDNMEISKFIFKKKKEHILEHGTIKFTKSSMKRQEHTSSLPPSKTANAGKNAMPPKDVWNALLKATTAVCTGRPKSILLCVQMTT